MRPAPPVCFSIHRLAHYCLDLSELFETSRVVPVVIFLNTRGSEPVQLNLGGDCHEYLRFHYIRCALQELNAEDYWESSNLIARLCLNLMKWKEEQKLEVYARAVQGLSTLEPDPEKQLKYIDFIDIYSALDDNEMEQYKAQYPQESNTMPPLVRNTVAKIAKMQRLRPGLSFGQRQFWKSVDAGTQPEHLLRIIEVVIAFDLSDGIFKLPQIGHGRRRQTFAVIKKGASGIPLEA